MRVAMLGKIAAAAAISPVLIAGIGMLVPARASVGEPKDAAASSTASTGMSKWHQRQQTVVALPRNDGGWVYKQVAWGADPTFYDPYVSPAGWHMGQAGFGTTNGACPWNNPADVHTPWTLNTDMLTRHWIVIPPNATNVRITGTIDNDATVYFNGITLQSVKSGGCQTGAINTTVPSQDLSAWYDLLAIRGHDYGVADYLDVTVTYDI